MHAVDLIAGLRKGDIRSLARVISIIEDAGPQAAEVLRALAPFAGSAHVVGITGAPGVGKSTSTNALVKALRTQGERVAVLAVDPSSPFSGGALLGDRIRMQDHAGDSGVYIRSMASRGHLGGLAASTPQVVRALDAAGFDVVIVETVGVGQSEVEIAAMADTSVVLLAPGMGDGIQAAKAGILEIGDIFVVNKADRDGADTTVRELRAMLDLGSFDEWKPPVIKTVASRSEGVEDLAKALADHKAWLAASGEHRARRLRRIREEIIALVIGAASQRLRAREAELQQACTDVIAGLIDPFEAAESLGR